MHHAIRNALPLAVVGLAALMLTGCPPSLTVEAGLDLYETVADDSKGNPQVMIEASIIEIEEDSIPADFFDEGSDPFGGKIELQGNPLGSSTQCDSSIGNTDTIIERKQDAELPRMNSEATVPIQLLELSLVCVDPIIVTYNGTSTEQWDLFITLNPTIQSNGDMTIRRTSRDGGTFGTTLDVYPRLTFVRPSDNEMRTLDIQDTLITKDAPWLTNVRNAELPSNCQSNFVPGFGKLPVIGRLFRQTVRMEGQSLMLMVTPRIIIQEEEEK